jgi:hypothetical protein
LRKVSYQCGVEQANRVQKTLGPKLEKEKVGLLELQRTVERIRNAGGEVTAPRRASGPVTMAKRQILARDIGNMPCGERMRR